MWVYRKDAKNAKEELFGTETRRIFSFFRAFRIFRGELFYNKAVLLPPKLPGARSLTYPDLSERSHA